MLVYFVIPLGGRNLIYATIGGTLVFALLSGFVLFVPHFIALGLMLAYLREPAIGRFWQRLTLGMRGGRSGGPPTCARWTASIARTSRPAGYTEPRSPKSAVPTRMRVAPSSIAASKSWLMPIESCGPHRPRSRA